MRAVIVYESMFGNTQTIAEAVALGLSIHEIEVVLCEVGRSRPEVVEGQDLVVVGAPTHALSLSRTESRASAAQQATTPLISSGEGVREWLARLPAGDGQRVATFDTHAEKRIPGSAAKSARKRLRRLGYRPVVPAESFYVCDMQGPLVDGEVERARAWGVRLAMAIGATVRPQPSNP